jgi:transposase
MAYPMEFRRIVAADYRACKSSQQVARKYGCSESWVRRLIQIERLTGSLAPRIPRKVQRGKLEATDLEQLRRLIAAKPDMTLGELAAALTKKVSVPTIHRATKKLKLPLKKSHSTRQSRTGPT